MKKQHIIIAIVLLTLVLASVQCSTTTSAPAAAPTTAPAAAQPAAPTQAEAQPAAPTQAEAQPAAPAAVDAKALTQQKCTECHSFNKASRFRGDSSAWQQIVEEMVQQGMNVTADEKAVIVKYLADTYK